MRMTSRAAFLTLPLFTLTRPHSHHLRKMSSSPRSNVVASARTYDFIDAMKASEIDRRLMSERYGHSLTQLMELAGLAVAHAIAQTVQDKQHIICVVCGPGNNGGDGLVAARHLFHFGYQNVCVWLPKPAVKQRFLSLLAQLKALPVQVHVGDDHSLRDTQVIVDAIFGFSFDGSNGIREPYMAVIDQINSSKHAKLISIDVPSGWHVDKGDIWSHSITTPHVLISLSAPKLCAQQFEQRGGTHYIGGRFIPKSLSEELQFNVVTYDGLSCVTKVT